LFALTAASPGDSAYTVIWVLVGIVTLGGSMGLLGVYKWAKRQGVRDSQVDRMIGVVLGDGNGGVPLKERMDAQDRKLDAIAREAKPNGGTTQRLGDIAKRTEEKVDQVMTKFDQHIGRSEEVHASLWREVRRNP
jgi:hypothetical protein